jgi:hypothetical protein
MPSAEIRKARIGVLGALVASCVFLPAASARQAASGEAQTKPTTTDSTSKPGSVKPASTKPASTKSGSTKSGSAASASATKSAGATHTASSVHHPSRKRRPAGVRGQKKIDADRARTIQEALIREHYLGGEPAGTWNQASEDAMRRYQGDHGWQTKEVPDSRALISLGLGPSKDHLLNPESAMTTGPHTPAATPPTASPTAAPAPVSPNAPAPTPVPTPSSGEGDPSSPH